MAKPWNPWPTERRQAMADAYRERRQWEKAQGTHTGPQSVAGKRASAMRGLKHGGRSAEAVALESWLASVRRLGKGL